MSERTHFSRHYLDFLESFCHQICLKEIVAKSDQPCFTRDQSILLLFLTVLKRCASNGDQPSFSADLSGHSEVGWDQSVQNMGTPLLFAGLPLSTLATNLPIPLVHIFRKQILI